MESQFTVGVSRSANLQPFIRNEHMPLPAGEFFFKDASHARRVARALMDAADWIDSPHIFTEIYVPDKEC